MDPGLDGDPPSTPVSLSVSPLETLVRLQGR